MRSTIISTLLVFAVSAYASGGTWGGLDATPSRSVALTDDGLALWNNPAGLSWEGGFSLDYAFSTSDKTYPRSHSVSIGIGSILFGYVHQDVSDDVSWRSYSVASAFTPHPRLSFGSEATWVRSDEPGYHDGKLTLGAQWRPSRWLSVGAIVDNPTMFDSDALPRDQASLTLGVGVRPIRALTFAADMSIARNERFADRRPVFRATLEPSPGLLLRGEADWDGRIAAGLSTSLGRVGIGGETYINDEGDHARSLGHIRFTSDRWPSLIPERKQVVTLRLTEGLPESSPKRFFFQGKKRTFSEVVLALDDAADDPSVNGLIVRLEGGSLGWAQYEELRAAVLKFKDVGKPTLLYATSCGNADYWLASAFDRIVLVPSGIVFLTGLSATHTHLRGTLDKLGISAQIEAIGEYKDAADVLTQEYPDSASLSNTGWLLDDIDEVLVSGIAAGRNVAIEEARRWIDNGPHMAREALRHGLVDTLAYADELDDVFESYFENAANTTELMDHAERGLTSRSWNVPPRIAIVEFEGEIVDGEGGRGIFAPQAVGDRDIAALLKRVRNDDRIEAVVLRIDSPGGSGFASDLIWRDLCRLRDERELPIIVSMGNVAGSGGYYVSIPGDVIVADSTTITGSIGVISGKVEMSRMYESIGVTKTIQTRGRFADLFTTARPFTEEERARLRESLRTFLDDFVEKAAEGRGLSFEQVDSIADGRVWTGREAREYQLVDEIGGVARAVEIAKEQAGIDPDDEVEIVHFSPRRLGGLPGMLMGFFGLDIELPGFSEYEAARRLVAPLQKGGVLYLAPTQIEIE